VAVVSERRSTALGWGLALSLMLVLVLAGLWLYGYQLYRVQTDRLAALEAGNGLKSSESAPAEAAAPAAGEALSSDTVAARLQANDQRVGTLRRELDASVAAAERALREQEALRLKLANAETMRSEVEAALEASRSRIAALEAELGAGASVDTLVDETGQLLAEVETVTPRDLATLGMELRLVERERDGARQQLDRALERITALETRPGGPATAPNTGQADTSTANPALAARLAELEADNQELAAARAALETTLAGVEAERSALAAAAATARADLQARLDAVAGQQDLSADLARELEVALTTAEGRIGELEASLADAAASRETLEAERAAARVEDLEAELASLTDELAAERQATYETAAVLTALKDEHRALSQTLEADRETFSTSLEAEREAALALAGERDALLVERDQLRDAVATAENEAEAATAAAVEATRLAEQAAEGYRAVLAQRDAARNDAAELELQAARMREQIADLEDGKTALEEDRAALERAGRDALDAQGAAHSAALAELTEERDALTAELAAERARVAALDGGAMRNGDHSDDGATAALRAADERIAALEAELDATVRLVGELGAEGPAAAVPQATANAVAPVPVPTIMSEVADANAQIGALEQELANAKARLESLQDLLFADWPIRPRAAPR
jgi:chromosome segregation ATPase